MTNNLERWEGLKYPDLIVMCLMHNDEGIPSIKDGVIFAISSSLESVLESLFPNEKTTQEIIPSTNITVMKNPEGRVLMSMFSPKSTNVELVEWLERFESKIEVLPWKFEMGKEATITELANYDIEELNAFNRIVDFLNAASIKGSWTDGVSQML